MCTRVTQCISDLTQAGNTEFLEPGGSGALGDNVFLSWFMAREGFRKKCVCLGWGEHALPSDICSILMNT